MQRGQEGFLATLAHILTKRHHSYCIGEWFAQRPKIARLLDFVWKSDKLIKPRGHSRFITDEKTISGTRKRRKSIGSSHARIQALEMRSPGKGRRRGEEDGCPSPVKIHVVHRETNSSHTKMYLPMKGSSLVELLIQMKENHKNNEK